MDWEREKAHQYEAGIKVGIKQGIEQERVQSALVLINEFNTSPEIACEKIGAPLDVVKERLTK